MSILKRGKRRNVATMREFSPPMRCQYGEESGTVVCKSTAVRAVQKVSHSGASKIVPLCGKHGPPPPPALPWTGPGSVRLKWED